MSTYYLIIEGEKVIVTEEVYRAYKRPEWAESRRKERESRCRNYKGVRCNEDCRVCDKVRSGSTLSLEKFIEDGYQFVDPFDCLCYNKNRPKKGDYKKKNRPLLG